MDCIRTPQDSGTTLIEGAYSQTFTSLNDLFTFVSRLKC